MSLGPRRGKVYSGQGDGGKCSEFVNGSAVKCYPWNIARGRDFHSGTEEREEEKRGKRLANFERRRPAERSNLSNFFSREPAWKLTVEIPR